MTTKEAFLKQKIKNFNIFIAEKIGKENNIYKEFEAYQNNMNAFLQNILQLSSYAKVSRENSREGEKYFDEDTIQKYLEMHGVVNKLEKADFEKLNRYFNMFLTVVNS